MSPLWIPNREVVFRVRVVRDVHAKPFASYLGYRGLAPDPCPTIAALAPAAAPAVAPVVSRGCPGGVPAVSPVVSPGVSWECPGGVPVVSRWCPGGTLCQPSAMYRLAL